MYGFEESYISKLSTDHGEQLVKGWPTDIATEFDGLSVLRFVGENPVVNVFLAKETKPERIVSLKILKKEFAANAEMRARFESEALAAAQIVHPNVAAIYRVGKREDELPYLTHEYIGGRSLADVLHSSDGLPVSDSTQMIVSLAKALAATHTKGIVHGNVRPENILVEQDSGRIALTNFGIVGQRTPDPTTEERRENGGPFCDLANTRAGDVFSFGAVATELLTDSAPENVAELLRRCLDSNPDARPTAEELVSQLAKDERTEAPQDLMLPTQRAAEWFLMRVAVVSGIVIMGIGAAVAYWLYQHYTQKPTNTTNTYISDEQ